MATFNERIQVVIDVVTDKATKGFKDFRTAVSEAEGFTGKLKAGVSSLGGIFGAATSGPLAMGAAVATAATFAVKAVSDYADLGVEIGNFATATGLATEDASRWIEVSGDLGVSAETLQGVFGKLNKSIDTKLFDDLGVSIARTSTGTVDANNTFLNVIERLQQIKDPAEQAKTAAQLLGKGWQSIAPIIGQSADDIRNRLNDVADVKVFDQKKVDDSKKFRDAFADLKDAGEEFAASLGEAVIPEVTALAKAAVYVVRQLKDLKNALSPSSGGQQMVEQQQQVNDLFEKYGSLLFDTKAAQDAGITSLSDFKDETAFASDESRKLIDAISSEAAELHSANAELAAHASNSDNSARAAALLANAQQRVADHTYLAKDSLDDARNALKKYQDQIKGRNDLVDLVVELDDIKAKLDGLTMTHAANMISDRDYWLQSAQLTGDAQQAVSDYIDGFENIPPTVKTKLLVSFDPSNPGKFLMDFQAELNRRTVVVGAVPGYPRNGPQDGPDTGPRGPRATSVGGFGRNSGGVNITVNAPVGANLAEAGRQVADALRAYYANGGEPV